MCSNTLGRLGIKTMEINSQRSTDIKIYRLCRGLYIKDQTRPHHTGTTIEDSKRSVTMKDFEILQMYLHG